MDRLRQKWQPSDGKLRFRHLGTHRFASLHRAVAGGKAWIDLSCGPNTSQLCTPRRATRVLLYAGDRPFVVLAFMCRAKLQIPNTNTHHSRNPPRMLAAITAAGPWMPLPARVPEVSTTQSRTADAAMATMVPGRT